MLSFLFLVLSTFFVLANVIGFQEMGFWCLILGGREKGVYGFLSLKPTGWNENNGIGDLHIKRGEGRGRGWVCGKGRNYPRLFA